MQPPLMNFNMHRRDMIECKNFYCEGSYAGDGGRRRTDNVAGFEIFGVDVREVEDEILASDGPVGGGGVDFNGFYGGRFAGGHDEDGIGGLEGAGVETAGDGEGVLDTAAEDVVDG